MLTSREQLIQRILDLGDNQIDRLTGFVDSMECGDSSPLFNEPPIPPQENPNGDGPRPAKIWPHAPLHQLTQDGTYIVTGGTLHKQHLFARPDYLAYLESRLLALAKEAGWRLEAWAVFSNHYHIVAHATDGCSGLDEMLKRLHGETAVEINRRDGEPGRQVWYNFWDTKLTYEKSYLARLNYVHQNAVKHGLVPVANQYPWCSAAWLERTAKQSQVRTIYSFKTERVNVRDEFDPIVSTMTMECGDLSPL